MACFPYEAVEVILRVANLRVGNISARVDMGLGEGEEREGIVTQEGS